MALKKLKCHNYSLKKIKLIPSQLFSKTCSTLSRHEELVGGDLMVKTDLCIIAHRSRQQGEGIFNSDSPLDDVLAKSFQAVLAVRCGQIQQP